MTISKKSLSQMSISLVVSLLLPILISIVITSNFQGRIWEHEPLHTVIEVCGAFCAILLALFYIMQRNDNTPAWRFWVIASFMSMGIIDLFHGSLHLENTSVWLHSAAPTIGGILISLVWIPSRKVNKQTKSLLVFATPILSILFVCASLLLSDILPTMTETANQVEKNIFSYFAIMVNVYSGLFYFLAAIWFGVRIIKKPTLESVFFLNLCLLFGAAGSTFQLSTPWDYSWWLWHFYRFLAFLLVFVNALFLMRKAELDLRNSTIAADYAMKRIADILEVVYAYAQGDHNQNCTLTDNNDQFDALGMGVNMMGDDIENTMRKLHSAKEHLEDRNRELEHTTKELHHSNQELEQFAYAASHDLQEPLRVIVSYLQFLEHLYLEGLDEKGKNFISRSINAAKRMQAMIQSLLSYSRISTRGNPFSSCNTKEIIQTVLEDMDTLIQTKKATVNYDELPIMVIDKEQIHRLFLNLIGNALKYCDKDMATVTISAKQDNGGWLFSIKDNGIGIEGEYKEKIFELFQRLHGRGKYEGTGLGLAMCKKIVERHGGKIWVESELGKGSTFFFTLSENLA